MNRMLRVATLLFFIPALLGASEIPSPDALMARLTFTDRAALEALPEGQLRYLVGVTKQTNEVVDFSSVTPEILAGGGRNIAFGRIERTATGFTWSGTIDSPGAVALRIHFTEFFLPGNASLTLANNRGDAFTYTGRGPGGTGEFWSNTIGGHLVNVTVDYRGNDLGRVLKALRFIVAEIGPLGPKFPMPDPQAGSNLCSFNASCIVNASCAQIPNAIQPARDAVAMILFVSGAFQYICSGGLIADSDTSTDIPYFLTANHCVSSGSEASSLEAYFQYESACGQCNTSLQGLPRTLGSSIMSTNRTGDYTLLRLSQPAPSGTAFLPWNSNPVAYSNGTMLYRISHPAGAPQAFSSQSVDTSRPTCRSWPRGERIYSSDIVGGTEGGSSGSPVLNAAGQIVGQLSGACGYNVNDPCDSASNATVDGAFASYFTEVEPFLGGGGSCVDADGDGYCFGDDCNDANPLVNPGAAEVCNNGIDDDCNGLIDSADPACVTNSCDLQPSKASCSNDNQCCSGKCKGKPGSQTCR